MARSWWREIHRVTNAVMAVACCALLILSHRVSVLVAEEPELRREDFIMLLDHIDGELSFKKSSDVYELALDDLYLFLDSDDIWKGDAALETKIMGLLKKAAATNSSLGRQHTHKVAELLQKAFDLWRVGPSKLKLAALLEQLEEVDSAPSQDQKKNSSADPKKEAETKASTVVAKQRPASSPKSAEKKSSASKSTSPGGKRAAVVRKSSKPSAKKAPEPSSYQDHFEGLKGRRATTLTKRAEKPQLRGRRQIKYVGRS